MVSEEPEGIYVIFEHNVFVLFHTDRDTRILYDAEEAQKRSVAFREPRFLCMGRTEICSLHAFFRYTGICGRTPGGTVSGKDGSQNCTGAVCGILVGHAGLFQVCGLFYQ